MGIDCAFSVVEKDGSTRGSEVGTRESNRFSAEYGTESGYNAGEERGVVTTVSNRVQGSRFIANHDVCIAIVRWIIIIDGLNTGQSEFSNSAGATGITVESVAIVSGLISTVFSIVDVVPAFMDVRAISEKGITGTPFIVGTLKGELVDVGVSRGNEINVNFSFVENSNVAFFESHSKVTATRFRVYIIDSNFTIDQHGVFRENFAIQNTAFSDSVLVNRVVRNKEG
jgi:hypothetical protein